MLPDLPSPLLRSFLTVVDCGSLAEAARRLGKSDSALSLQMSRLEDLIGQRLFDRDGRTLRVNQTGSQLVGYARAILGRIDAARRELSLAAPPIRIGIVQDFVQSVLRPTMADLRATDPGIIVEVRVAGTGELLKAIGAGELDVALCATDLIGSEGSALQAEWFGDPALLALDVLPLVSVTPPCPYLSAAQTLLDAAGRAHRMAVVTPSLDGVRAAVEAGFGIACRTEAGMALPRLDHGESLPRLPKIPYTVVKRGGYRDKPDTAAIMAAHFDALAASDAAK